MHLAMPAYDTRRGASLHRSVDGYAEADALDDRHERERALAAVRATGNRERRAAASAPSAHQLAAILADAVALVANDPAHPRMMKDVFGPALKAAMRHRGFDAASPEVRRLLALRLRRPNHIVESEMRARIEHEIEADRRARLSPTMIETIAIINSLRDDDDE